MATMTVLPAALRRVLLGGMRWAEAWYRPGGNTPAGRARAFVQIPRRQRDGGAGSR